MIVSDTSVRTGPLVCMTNLNFSALSTLPTVLLHPASHIYILGNRPDEQSQGLSIETKLIFVLHAAVFHSISRDFIESHENTTTSTANSALSIQCQRGHKQDRSGWQNCEIRHEPTFFCSSLINSKPIWLRPEEVQFEPTKYLHCINIDTATK